MSSPSTHSVFPKWSLLGVKNKAWEEVSHWLRLLSLFYHFMGKSKCIDAYLLFYLSLQCHEWVLLYNDWHLLKFLSNRITFHLYNSKRNHLKPVLFPVKNWSVKKIDQNTKISIDCFQLMHRLVLNHLSMISSWAHFFFPYFFLGWY